MPLGTAADFRRRRLLKEKAHAVCRSWFSADAFSLRRGQGKTGFSFEKIH